MIKTTLTRVPGLNSTQSALPLQNSKPKILKRNSIGPLASYNQKMMMIRNKSVLSRYNIIDQYAFEKNIGELQKGTPL